MKPNITISEAFELYRVEVIVYKNQSAKTEEMSGLAAKSLINYCGDIPVSQSTFDLVREWTSDLRKTRRSNTVRGYILKLRVVLRHLKRSGYDVMDSELIGVPKRDSHVVDYLEVDEAKRLLEASFEPGSGYSTFKRYRNRAIIALLFSAGIRNGELCSMDRHQIKDGINSFTIIGKGNKPRVCFIDPVTHRYIDEYLALRDDPYPALFVSEQQKGREKINPGVVQMVVKNAAIKAGLEKNIHPHTLRHSSVTDLLKNNTNIVYVKELLGHASIQVTMTYTHVANEDLHQIHRPKHTIVHA